MICHQADVPVSDVRTLSGGWEYSPAHHYLLYLSPDPAMSTESSPATSRDQAASAARPLLLLLGNLLLVAVSGLAGGIGLLLAGEWKAVIVGLAAGLAYPVALLLLHWLRWLIDIPAMFASQARWHLTAAILNYLSDLFVSLLVLSWLMCIAWGILALNPPWAALCWGYALVAGPLLLVILSPAGYPLLMLLVMVAQGLYPLAWILFRLADVPVEYLLQAIAVLALLLPLVEFSSRWQSATRPD